MVTSELTVTDVLFHEELALKVKHCPYCRSNRFLEIGFDGKNFFIVCDNYEDHLKTIIGPEMSTLDKAVSIWNIVVDHMFLTGDWKGYAVI